MRYHWSRLNRIQKGSFGKYFAKMEFTIYEFAVYASAAYEIRFTKSRNEILEPYNFDTRVKQLGA